MSPSRPVESPALPERPDRIADRIVAWRCEHCRKLMPMNIEALVILVDDLGGPSHSGGVTSRGRIARRMVVCPPCKRSIAGGLS